MYIVFSRKITGENSSSFYFYSNAAELPVIPPYSIDSNIGLTSGMI